MSETASPAPASAAPSPASVGSDAIKQAVDQLRASLPKLQETNPAYASGLSNFLQSADDPVRLNQAEFQHRIAYAVKDVEQITGQPSRLGGQERDYINALSTSAPGLRDDRVQDLLSASIASVDRSLRNDIRRTAIEIGKQADQNTPQIQSQLETLENRVRLSASAIITKPTAPPTAEATNTPPASPGLDASGRTAGSAQSATAQHLGSQPSAPTAEAAHARADQQQARQSQVNQEPYGQAGAGAAIAGTMLRGFQKLGEAIPPPPWEAMTTNFGDRLKSFETRQQARSDQKVIDGLEQSGANALSALQNLTNNEGAAMMSRVNQAARSDPNGIEGVLAEMRPGGKYAALRQQFNVAITDEKGFAAAYDKAVEAVGQYASDRKAASPIVARGSDAVAVTARLEALEQNVGERMAGIPSLSDGKTMLEDLRKQAAEVFKAIADGIKNLFQRASPRASPSPGP